MSEQKVVEVLDVGSAKQRIILQSKQLEEWAKQLRWKAENNIRFYEKLGMTTDEKVDFLSKEFSNIYWLGTMNRLACISDATNEL